MKRCGKCKELKPVTEFYKSKTKGHGSYCKPCQHEHYKQRYHYRTKVLKQPWQRYNLQYRERNRNFIASYLTSHACVDCGESDTVVLDFDHVRGEKLYNISQMVAERCSIKTIEAEIAKCEVRCSNCHRRKTALTLWPRLRKRARSEISGSIEQREALALWSDV